MMSIGRFLGSAVLSLLVCAWLAEPAAAQAYPTKTIRIVASSNPGGSVDLVSRILA